MFIFKARMFGYRVSLWIAQRLGRTFYSLKHGWFPPVFWLLVTSLFIWFIDAIRHIANPKADYWFQFWYILAVFVILWLLWSAWQGHKRVVIETFMDYTGAEPVSDAQGLATLLVVHLAQLHELYRAVDEQRAISTAATSNQPIDATIKVDDVSDFLTGAVSAQSKLSLGPLEIPIGTLLALVGRFVQGPRIIGSLHKDNANLILTAQRVGGRPAYSWRVDSVSSSTPAHEAPKNIDEMINELACRIFTDLSLSGTVRWKAAKSFSEGLRFYRDCLRTSKECALKLRQAERKFIETLEEDKDFVLAHYNLGVVYMELGQVDEAVETGQLEAAEEAFTEAISHNPGSWIAYYALAVCRYQQKQYDSAYRICQRISERAITQKPGQTNIAKIFHMIGLAQMKGLARSGPFDHQSITIIGANELHAAMRNYTRALRQAWRALCKAELLQLGVTETDNLLIPQLEATLSVCMKDLAMAYTHFAESKQQQLQILPEQAMKYDTYYQKAHELLHQATFLNSSDSENYAALFDTYTHSYVHVAKMYCERQDYPQAIKEYRAALRINPDDARFWASFALACASLYKLQKKGSPEAEESKAQALQACDNAKNYAFALSNDTKKLLDIIIETYGKLEETVLCQQATSVAGFLQKVSTCQANELPSLAELDDLVAEADHIAQNDTGVQGWIYAQVSLVIGKKYLHCNQQDRVERYVRKVITCLEKAYPHVIREQEWRVILIYSLLQQEKYEVALQEAEHALVLDPLCYLEREALGDVYYKLNAFENAITAWKEALLRKSTFIPKLKELPKIETPVLDFKLGTTYLFKQDEVDINFKIGISYVELGRHYYELTEKRNAYSLALAYLEHAEALYESKYQHQEQKHALYYFLGVLHFEQNEYQCAISYLRIAKTLHFAPLTSLFYLSYAYLKNKAYDSCIKHFQILQNEALRLVCEGKPQDEIVEDETVGFMALGELLAMAHWGMAYAYAERNANLEKARELVQKAQTYMSGLLTETKVHWPAYCLDCEGWILFKLGEVDEAITVLKRAVILSASPQVYAHLALAYVWKLQQANNGTLLQDLRYCYQQVQALDIKNEYGQEMAVVLQHLQKADQPEKHSAYD